MRHYLARISWRFFIQEKKLKKIKKKKKSEKKRGKSFAQKEKKRRNEEVEGKFQRNINKKVKKIIF